MNAIVGFTELLRRHLEDREAILRYLEKIETSNEILLSLINNVLEMARIESGKESLNQRVCNAYEFNSSLFSLFETTMKAKGIIFTHSVELKHPNVFIDDTKLREILLNILSNAEKYTPTGGKIRLSLRELPSKQPGYALYRTTVEDTGIGMSKEFLPRLFDEFARETSGSTRKISGTGLGMPIVKKLVELMDGMIQVESELGKGTKFTITLPHRIAQEVADLEEKEMSEADFKSCIGKRLLLVEDNELNAEIVMTILEEEGFLVEHAEDGLICVDMLKKAPEDYYALILMDVQMPNMNGYEATKAIRQLEDSKKAALPIIAMTANAFKEDEEKSLKAGMTAHLAKPLDIEQTKRVICEQIRKTF